MNWYVIIGRIFLGLCLIGIGILQIVFPGIRPIIAPDATHIPSDLYGMVYVIAAALIISGTLICMNVKTIIVSLIIALAFFLLFLFGHLPAFLSVHGLEKLKYWVNMNKNLALSGGFLILAAVIAKNASDTKFHLFVSKLILPGRYFFSIMLLLFGIGHLTSTTSLSALVPPYIPFAKFWTFLGGIVLVISAISISINLKSGLIALILAITLFTWLVTLHFYYAILSPGWQEGENFIGVLTCMAFCGTALLVSQTSQKGL